MSKTQQSTAQCLLGQGPSPIHHNLAVMPEFWYMTLSPGTFGAQPTSLQTMRAALFKIDKNDILFYGKHAKICRTAVDGKQPFRSYDSQLQLSVNRLPRQIGMEHDRSQTRASHVLSASALFSIFSVRIALASAC
jgi:hypothetical protein